MDEKSREKDQRGDKGYFTASEVLKKVCASRKGVEAVRKSPALLKSTIYDGNLLSSRPSGWCGMSAGKGQESAWHRLRRWCGKKRFFPSAQKMLIKKKPKTSSTAREGPPAVERPMIDMTSSNEEKNKDARSEPVAPVMSRMANSIVDMPKSMPRCPLGAKSGSYSGRLTIMNNHKVDSTAKVALRPIPSATKTDSPARNEETARVGSYEKSTKPTSREAAEICVLLKPDLLDDMDACANKAAKEVVKTMAAEPYSSSEEIKSLDSELVSSKGLKKEVDELQRVRVGFKIFFISPENLLAFTFEASISEIVEEVGAQARASGGEALDDAAVKSVTIAKVEDHIVGCFGPPIAFRISQRGYVLLDAILLEELRHTFAHELWAVVSDDGLWDTKSANDVPPYEVLYVHLSRGRPGLCFYPFGEVVGYHDHYAFTPSRRRHKSYQVNCPLHESPMTRIRV
ncbi:hypothetical protein D8674_024949 [Pyrus ussuriensis x Pyrus communis]|uniref:Uncharacterized protein n=1 Tax=Pyrus ussuriensis x Pyrus communis TaxID=2448454 RepID=A0A5N5H709_9ROSA|nr:hypothetical protein D8674_024949 [Pyrus ussuriensis x Pyrus communis]